MKQLQLFSAGAWPGLAWPAMAVHPPVSISGPPPSEAIKVSTCHAKAAATRLDSDRMSSRACSAAFPAARHSSAYPSAAAAQDAITAPIIQVTGAEGRASRVAIVAANKTTGHGPQIWGGSWIVFFAASPAESSEQRAQGAGSRANV